MGLIRTRDPSFLNYVSNDPKVLPWISLGAIPTMDLSPALADPSSFILQNSFGGFLLVRPYPHIYEVHTMFLPEGRGALAKQAGEEGKQYMFTKTDCSLLLTYVTLDNKHTRRFTRHMGFDEIKDVTLLGKNMTLYGLHKDKWRATCQQ